MKKKENKNNELKIGNLKIQKVTLIVAILIIIGLIVIGVLTFKSIKNNQEQRVEEKYKNQILEMGKNFYEDFFYDIAVNSQGIELIQKYSETGIKVDLNSLAQRNDDNKKIVESMVNPKTNEKCDTSNSKVIIYPKDPYSKTDYTLEAILECNLN